MANPGFGMYSNNNYIPDIGQFNGQQPRCRQTTMTGFPNSAAQGVPFSFAVPTQANSYTFAPSQSYQPRGIYSNPVIQQAIAPGMGTPWQHAVPNQMPWGEDGRLSQAPGISTFSANSAMNVPLTSIYSSIPSCSTTPKRHKRHSSIDIEKEAPSTKCLVTEEKMAAKMEGLSLDHGLIGGCSSSGVCNGPNYSTDDLDLDFGGNQERTSCSLMSEDWKKFRELENRLNSESDEEDTQTLENGVKVHISKSIAKEILESPTILPQKILNDLNKPCMEMVLWQSPGGFNPENVKTTSEPTTTTSSSSIQSQPVTTTTPIFCLNSNNSKNMDEDEMDMDDMEL